MTGTFRRRFGGSLKQQYPNNQRLSTIKLKEVFLPARTVLPVGTYPLLIQSFYEITALILKMYFPLLPPSLSPAPLMTS
jgi:hypothetical protein